MNKIGMRILLTVLVICAIIGTVKFIKTRGVAGATLDFGSMQDVYDVSQYVVATYEICESCQGQHPFLMVSRDIAWRYINYNKEWSCTNSYYIEGALFGIHWGYRLQSFDCPYIP